ncbi:uncharacterized protein LOC126424792 isoform X12 [Schistocerca serialis cubense]|uniref:uncharacterized protein LOC126424792 isoform X7 n=1 Tax=Schistocerca serialis cubense TaxID=2023355 RepID=UPI00214EFBE4|nr:uncharacterized protein LOC126424792 isoform X7 [Schistocerca serialis cubense]XP_049943534.1 uncharacterized protein LOC126424792 isoform X12 [Schistocerca serialis cubense]
MHPVGVAAPLLVLLAANGTTVLDCVCDNISTHSFESYGAKWVYSAYCSDFKRTNVMIPYKTLQYQSNAVRAMLRLITSWTLGRYSLGYEGCDDGLAALAGLPDATANDQLAMDLACFLAADCIDSCSASGSNITEWNVETLTSDDQRRPVLFKLLRTLRHITKAIRLRRICAGRQKWNFLQRHMNKTELDAEVPVYLEHVSSYLRNVAQLLSHGVRHISAALVPFAFDIMDTHPNDELLSTWINHVEHMRDMLHVKLRGWVQDMQYVSEQTANYKVEEDKKSPGKYIIRLPLLNYRLLSYHEQYPAFRDDFSAQCERQQPEASSMFALADLLYGFYYSVWFNEAAIFLPLYEIHYVTTSYGGPSNEPPIDIKGEEWQLEDKSNAMLSVDTGCMQLLANALDHPTCPLEDLPPETTKRREQCRVQLWHDLSQGSPHVPVTSYLAYTQRANVNLCLFAWMTVNSVSICQDVPFSMIQSVRDARCVFGGPDDQPCPQLNASDAVCSVCRAILLLKCRDFASTSYLEACRAPMDHRGWYSSNRGYYIQEKDKPTNRILSYKDNLNSGTLKYRDFKIEGLEPLEITFVAVNILFRFLTAAVYVYLPNLRNLPGKIFLSFQITGMVQILFSEVLYRMAGVPDLSTTVQIDSALTLLNCIWLNSFCYQMYACVRHLRLPSDLERAEARKVFRRQLLCSLIPWSVVLVATIALERTSEYYLLHSRVIFIVGISLSVAYNIVCLGLVGYMYRRTRNSMRQLKIYSKETFGSKKLILYMSAKTVTLSGIGTIVRIGFHQAQGIAQYVYYVHIATMVQGPLLFVLFVCNNATLPLLRERLLARWNPDVIGPGQELCSSAERNLAKRVNVPAAAAESTL